MDSLDARTFSLSLLLGRKELLSEEIYFLFAKLGLAHALCASGLHVQIMCNFAYIFLRLFQYFLCSCHFGFRWKLYRSSIEYPYFLCILISYASLCHWTIPITRAVLSHAFLLFLFYQKLTLHKAYVFSLVAILSLIIGKGSYLSFLLSFTATLSFYFMSRSGQSFLQVLFWGLLLPSLATTPLVVYFFHIFSPISFFSNLLFFPLLQIDLFLSILELSTAKLSIFSFFHTLNSQFVEWQIGLLQMLAKIPYGSLWCSVEKSFSLWAIYIFLYYGFRKLSLPFPWFLLCLLPFGFLFSYATSLLDRREAIILNVGQGDSILFRSPKEAPFLVDAGAPSKSPYTSRASLALARRQVPRLSGILLTHPDRDHQGGFASVLLRHRVGKLWINKDHLFYSKIFSFLREAERASLRPQFLPHLKTTAVYSGLYCIALPNLKKNSNDSSPMCKFYFSSKESLLITGDMSQKKEKEFLLWYPQFLSSTHLKLGHHGSNSSSHISFLKRVGAKKTYVSAGTYSRYSHPHKDVVKRVQEVSATVESTMEEGDIFLP